MKIPTWLEAALAIGLLLAGWSWFRAHDALRDALAQKDVLTHEKADLQSRIDASGKAEQKANQALDDLRRKPATVQTVTKLIPIPGPVEIREVPGKAPEVVIGGDAQKTLDALQNFGIDCEKCKNSLLARDSQYADLQKQLQLSDQNGKNWEKAAHKGTGFWARTKEWGIRAGFAFGGYAAGKTMK